jgi:hypothetical protein
MWAKQVPWTQLEREQLEWHTHTNTHTHTETYTHLPLCHWHTLVIVTPTHKHIDRVLYTCMTSYLPQSYRLSILIDKETLFINSWLVRLSVDNVLLINTRRLSILIDKSIPLSIGVSTVKVNLLNRVSARTKILSTIRPIQIVASRKCETDRWFYYIRIKKDERQGKNVTLELWWTVRRWTFEHNTYHVPLRQTVPELWPKID